MKGANDGGASALSLTAEGGVSVPHLSIPTVLSLSCGTIGVQLRDSHSAPFLAWSASKDTLGVESKKRPNKIKKN